MHRQVAAKQAPADLLASPYANPIPNPSAQLELTSDDARF